MTDIESSSNIGKRKARREIILMLVNDKKAVIVVDLVYKLLCCVKVIWKRLYILKLNVIIR
jgi:hypothetical protein